jgi:PAS domain S-box-containing protein
VNVDITDRKQMETEMLELERLKVSSESRKLWQDTFDSITDLISLHDRERTILMANQAFLKYFNLAAEDAIGKKCYEMFHQHGFPTEGCPMERTVTTGQPARAIR